MNYQPYRPPRFFLMPNVVKNLLIINVLFFIAKIVIENRLQIPLTDLLGLHYPGAEEFRPYQLITYMFMHGNFTHLFFNMFALWMFGSQIEIVWGPKRFLLYYLVTGLGAAFIHYVVVYFEMQPILQVINDYLANPSMNKFQELLKKPELGYYYREVLHNSPDNTYSILSADTPEALRLSISFMNEVKTTFLNAPNVVGASGAVFGLLLAFGMLFPNNIIYIYFAIPIKAKYFVILYGILELYMGVANSGVDNVAHFAHLGGMLFGFIFIKYWGKFPRRF